MRAAPIKELFVRGFGKPAQPAEDSLTNEGGASTSARCQHVGYRSRPDIVVGRRGAR